jgi:hypothetical protein
MAFSFALESSSALAMLNSSVYIFTIKINMDTTNGPKIKPTNPNKLMPIITPNMVMRGWISPVFFCNKKRAILFIVPIRKNLHNDKAIA